ncbi:MAG: PilN domain-containing protein [Rhodocyclaceae bacterium]|nr:PilN domain-containing protein [Rhodocyclaceae bacterium]MDZ4215039.1 PilN domain-containing protein [Rhodocyclaceae bacterium]
MALQINLYDPALERKRDWLALENVVIGGVLLATAVGALGMAERSSLPALGAQVASGETQVKAVRDQILVTGRRVASRKPDPRIEQALAAQQQLLSIRGEVLATLRSSVGPDAHSYAEYLRGFARQTVSGLWLTGFSIQAAGGGMEIRGNATDPALIPEYIRRLNKEAAFEGQTFAALKLERPAAKGDVAPPPWHEFMLTPTREGKAATPADNRSAAPSAPTFAASAAGGAG